MSTVSLLIQLCQTNGVQIFFDNKSPNYWTLLILLILALIEYLNCWCTMLL